MKLGLRYQTTYRYEEPVGFSPHEVRLFPRSDRFSRVRRLDFTTTPKATIRYSRDVFENTVASCYFPERSKELTFRLAINLDLDEKDPFHFILDPDAVELPFAYDGRTRDLLVIADVALTLVLLSSAGLVLKSFARMQSLALGFEPRGLTTARITLPYSTYRGRDVVAKFGQNVVEKIAALPGVEKAAIGGNPPMLAGWMVGFYREDRAVPPPSEQPGAESEVVAGDYLGALKTNLLRGRAINERDNTDAPLVCMIDQILAEKYFPGEDPIGKHLSSDPDGNGNENRSFEIVGIVSRIKFHGAEATPPRPIIYFSLGQTERHRLVLLVRSALPTPVLEKSLREIVASIDPRQPVYEFRAMSDLVADTWATQRLLTFLLSVFAALALGLASIGLYGVLAYTTLKRVREIGIRIALGARPAQVGALIMNHALRLLSLGCVIGLVGALAASRALQSVLFQAGNTDLQVYFIVGGILLFATLLASWSPTRRACKVDPIVALRIE
jgi:putative ABC transport system permease protein